MVVQGSALKKTELFSGSGTGTTVFCIAIGTKWGFRTAVRRTFKC